MFLQDWTLQPGTTGNARVDALVSLGIVLASAGATIASIIATHHTHKPSGSRRKRHTPAPVPRTRARKELDAMNGQG
jgi:hypothetical protein